MRWELRILATLLPILYGLASLAYVLIFFRNDPVARRYTPRLLVFTLALHVIYLVFLGIEEHRVPIGTSFEAMSALALALGIAYVFQERHSGTPHTGLIFLPLIFICQTLASAFTSLDTRAKPMLESPLFGVHIATALLGYAAFAVSAIFGVLYVLLYHNLKAHRFGIVYERLPSLEVLSGMNLRAATFGLVSLTLAIAAGAMWSLQVYPQFWSDPKVWLSVATWSIYAMVLTVRYASHWRGPRIAYFTIAGFMLVVISMLVVSRHGA